MMSDICIALEIINFFDPPGALLINENISRCCTVKVDASMKITLAALRTIENRVTANSIFPSKLAVVLNSPRPESANNIKIVIDNPIVNLERCSISRNDAIKIARVVLRYDFGINIVYELKS